MEYATLGNTGIEVSVAGLGCGGPSLVGLKQDKSGRLSIRLVRQAIDLGVNFLAPIKECGTGMSLARRLPRCRGTGSVVSTKKTFLLGDAENAETEIRRSLERSLKQLRTGLYRHLPCAWG